MLSKRRRLCLASMAMIGLLSCLESLLIIARADVGDHDRIDLTAAPWTFSSRNGSIKGVATVPGDIYMDLQNARVIDEPLRDNNDQLLRWVPRTDWIYTCRFAISETWLKRRAVLLSLRGVDAIAKVFLNDAQVVVSTNQFLSHLVPLDVWSVGVNELRMEFESPVEFAKKEAIDYQLHRGHVLPPDCPDPVFHGECHQNFIRKIQASFSWDWGPSFPTVGVWLPISIEAFDLAYIDALTATVKKEEDYFVVESELAVYSALDASGVAVEVSLPELPITVHATASLKSKQLAYLTARIVVLSSKVQLWWPNGHGKQTLYELHAKINVKGSEIVAKPIKIGFRSVALVQDYVDDTDRNKGRNFYFKVNDVPIFLKGSNWIPVSAFPGRNHSARMEFLLESSREANMNAMRVWGGGRYEPDEFYELTDRLGILIWHDFMFACALYPATSHFLMNVRKEITQQVRRLRHHASILLWAGNNENELGVTSWWYMPSYPRDKMRSDYVKLYRDTIKPIVEALDGSRPYVLSSPSNGIETDVEGGIAAIPNSERYGDIHFYNEQSDLWADHVYKTPRCASEYGVQSLPRKETMLHWINVSEWNYTSKGLVARQHHPGGIIALLYLVFSHFKVPQQCDEYSKTNVSSCKFVNSSQFLDRFTYYTQMHQAIAYQVQTEHYRRFRGRLDATGLGNTMCALYWQLNDLWAAPTWSTIDFDLCWKPAHYFARRFFAEIIVSSSINRRGELEVFVVSDAVKPLSKAKVVVDALAWTGGFAPVYSTEASVEVPPSSSTQVPLNLLINDTHSADSALKGPEEYVIRSRLFASDGSQVGYDSVLLPDQFYRLPDSVYGNATISKFEEIDDSHYRLTLHAERIAPLVVVETKAGVVGWFSDNAFTMTQPEKTVLFAAFTKPAPSLTRDDFTVCTLASCGLS